MMVPPGYCPRCVRPTHYGMCEGDAARQLVVAGLFAVVMLAVWWCHAQ
jgi:hypothetical protein